MALIADELFSKETCENGEFAGRKINVSFTDG